jgi:hypothetical protein
MNGNDMAFPALDEAFTPNGSIQVGLTKREYFAASLMPHMLQSQTFQGSARDAVAAADALLEALAATSASGGADGGIE